MIRFLLNNSEVETGLHAGSTVLDFVRHHKRLMGTKAGCREGDCGACTVLVGDFENGQLVYRSMTSCLMPLGNAAGKHILTVEGLNEPELSPVQRAMVETNGTQCGFCTLGFVLSFTGFVLTPGAKSYESAIAAIDGNICRCTGYKSIERAAQLISDQLKDKPLNGTLEWLVAQKMVPAYFTGIAERLRALRPQETARNIAPNEMHLGGGTDLLVQRPRSVKAAAVQLLYDETPLQSILFDGTELHIGGSVTVTRFLESEVVRRFFPGLPEHMRLVSSTPIRNMATIAGNLVNASPIGDMTIFLLALNARLALCRQGERRSLPLRDFYRGYKQLDKAADEIVETITFVPPGPHTHFHFEKVSKRTFLDIASVNSACMLQLGGDGRISRLQVSAGGVAPFPKYLEKTSDFLTGKILSLPVFEEAVALMQEEVAPISDARGTAAYKRLLLRQLLAAHLQVCPGSVEILNKLLPA